MLIARQAVTASKAHYAARFLKGCTCLFVDEAFASTVNNRGSRHYEALGEWVLWVGPIFSTQGFIGNTLQSVFSGSVGPAASRLAASRQNES